MFLEKRFLSQNSLGNSILSIGESITKGTRFYRKESKNPENVCLTCSCNGLRANTSKCHLVLDLSRCAGPCSLRALWRCEGAVLGQGTAGYSEGPSSCKGICHPVALPLCDVSMRTVFNEESWAQTSSGVNLDTSHLGDCWKC